MKENMGCLIDKKRIYLIITIIISLFIFIKRVDAVYMWLHCPAYDPKDKSASYYTTFAVVNNNSNKPSVIAIAGYDYNSVGYNRNNFNVLYRPKIDSYTQSGIRSFAKSGDKYCWLTETSKKGTSCTKKKSIENLGLMVNDGYCPTAARNSHLNSNQLVFVGKKQAPSMHKFSLTNDNNKFIIYRFTTKGQRYTIAEGYDVGTGRYIQYRDNTSPMNFNTDIKKKKYSAQVEWSEFIAKEGNDYYYYDKYLSWSGATQIVRMINCKDQYYNLSENNYCSLMASLAGTKDDVDFEMLYDSNDTNGKLKAFVEKWYDKNVSGISSTKSKLVSLKGTDNRLFDAATKIKEVREQGIGYYFDENYSVTDMILDMIDAIPAAEKIISTENTTEKFVNYDDNCNAKLTTNDASTSLISSFYCDTFKKHPEQLYGIEEKNNQILTKYIMEELNNQLTKASGSSNISFINIKEQAKDCVQLYYIAVNYLLTNSGIYNISPEDMQSLDALKSVLSSLLERIGITVVVDCESLIGEDLINKINDYLDIIKYAIPILLIGFGVIDFTKAIFAADEEKMKKAQKDFITRIIIAVIIFLCPFLINILLQIANRVWNFISPNSCGLF